MSYGRLYSPHWKSSESAPGQSRINVFVCEAITLSCTGASAAIQNFDVCAASKRCPLGQCDDGFVLRLAARRGCHRSFAGPALRTQR